MKTGYRYALHHVFHMLKIAAIPNLDCRPAVEQQIDKLIEIISSLKEE